VSKNLNFPIEVINNANIISDQDMYLVATAVKDYKQCIVKFADGIGDCEELTAETNLQEYNYKLSNFPLNSDNNPEFHLSEMSSGRVFLSIKYPLFLNIDSSNPKNLTIISPDGCKSTDRNYYTIYDKFEFTYNAGGLWINPTSVDFFSIPLKISLPSSTSSFKESGLEEARSDILDNVTREFGKYSSKDEWDNLFLKFDNDTVLRVISPGKAMLESAAGSTSMIFPPNYLDSYIVQLLEYYKSNTIKVDCSELKAGIYQGKVFENNQFIFTREDADDVIFDNINSVFFFGGSFGDGSVSDVSKVIARDLTSAFNAGLLPAKNDSILSNEYFKSNSQSYYEKNEYITNNAPYFDIYARALHAFKLPTYAFAYDDELGRDGTLQDPNSDNIGKVTVTIGDMTGTLIPDPFTDENKYDVTIILGRNAHCAYYPLEYNESAIMPNPPKVVQKAEAPMEFSFNGEDVKVYFNPTIITSDARNFMSDGIDVQSNNGVFTVNFPSPDNSVVLAEPAKDDAKYTVNIVLGSNGNKEENCYTIKYDGNKIKCLGDTYKGVSSPMLFNIDGKPTSVYLKELITYPCSASDPILANIVVAQQKDQTIFINFPGPSADYTGYEDKGEVSDHPEL
jgi:hypothetical protein